MSCGDGMMNASLALRIALLTLLLDKLLALTRLEPAELTTPDWPEFVLFVAAATAAAAAAATNEEDDKVRDELPTDD